MGLMEILLPCAWVGVGAVYVEVVLQATDTNQVNHRMDAPNRGPPSKLWCILLGCWDFNFSPTLMGVPYQATESYSPLAVGLRRFRNRENGAQKEPLIMVVVGKHFAFLLIVV